MEIKPGLSALVTGGASGIGKALCLALAEGGVAVSVVDVFEGRGEEVASLAEKLKAKNHGPSFLPPCQFIRCDVTNAIELAYAFEKHSKTYGGLDICINSAGIANPSNFYDDQTDGSQSWKRTINVNFVSIVDCTRLAAKAMIEAKRPGVIINVGSASGFYPLQADPVYSGTKAGVVMFTRAVGFYRKKGIRVNVLCPEFVETDLGSKVGSKLLEKLGGFIPMDMIIKGAFELITDESKANSCLYISNRKGLEYWHTHSDNAKFNAPSRMIKRPFSPSVSLNLQIPESFNKVVVHNLTHHFRTATKIVRAPLKLPVKPDHVLIKIMYAGVNASDVNFSSGRYFSGKEDIKSKLPFDTGFEAVGVIAAIGDSVTDLKVGSPAALMTYGAYAEFVEVSSKHVLPVPRPDPEVVALLTSGLTASIALEKAAQMGSGKVILVTAAAGGTGQFAVQLAKLAGNHVVATCGGEEKARMLKQLGVDRVIDYKREDLKSVLKQEYPKGIDVIYESVGGQMFDVCLNALAVYGCLIVIGMISQYQGEKGWSPSNYTGLCEKILAKSQTVSGFFLIQYGHLYRQHLEKLFDLYSTGKLKVSIDPKKFVGVESVADAVEYLHSGKSLGKVVVSVDPKGAMQMAKL